MKWSRLQMVCAWLLALALALGPMPLTAQEPAKPAEEKKEEKKPEKKKDLPLEPTRKIEFTTDEGTWLSLDVSPDGQTIVFELLGDLYTIPIAGGEAKRLPVSDSAHKDGNGMAFDSQPRFSPDGKWIAFISDRDGAENLWICKSDGTEPRALTKEQRMAVISPVWMPTSQYVIVAKGMDFWMVHINGGSGINLTGAEPTPGQPGQPPAPGPARRGAAVSPDGRYLYFSQKPGGQSVYNQMNFGWQVARRDLKTGDTDMLTQGEGAAVRPLLSPDGRYLVYGTRFETQTGLRLRDLNSGEDRWLRYPVQRDDMESASTRDLLPA